jgi:Arc/MetJ-type ribon-helix-helix transcriptional regulator
MVAFRMPESLTARIDAYIEAQPEPRPTRSEAIRHLIDKALVMPAAVKSPALPSPSEAFLRALGHREENGEGPGVRLRKGAK